MQRRCEACSAVHPQHGLYVGLDPAVSGDRAFDIKSGYALPDPAFPEDTAEYDGDDGDPAQGGCDHLAVLTLRTDDAYFGGIAGRTSYDTVARTVGRVAVAAEAQGNPAFLMLERKGRNTLSEQVGTSELGIVVDAADADNPGFIHVDSKGDPSTGCNGNNNAGGWAVYGDDSSSPKIVVKADVDWDPGNNRGPRPAGRKPADRYGASTLAGIEPDPTLAGIVSRKPVDDKYNSSGEPSITDLHSDAVQYVNGTTPPPNTYPAARPGSWTVISGWCATTRSRQRLSRSSSTARAGSRRRIRRRRSRTRRTSCSTARCRSRRPRPELPQRCCGLS